MPPVFFAHAFTSSSTSSPAAFAFFHGPPCATITSTLSGMSMLGTSAYGWYAICVTYPFTPSALSRLATATVFDHSSSVA